MNLEYPSNKILVTGASGFTGKALVPFLIKKGFDVSILKSNILDKDSIKKEILMIDPQYVIHLAAVSFTEEKDVAAFYQVNVQGTINLLDALKALNNIKKIILVSSAAVYGNQNASILSEDMHPRPVSHYGCSKLSMECMSENFSGLFPTLITRPFNYTGIGQENHFLVPKIVSAYKNQLDSIELGNLDVYREFNDIRDICNIYFQLLINESAVGTVNICTGKSVCVRDILEKMNVISGHNLTVNVNPLFVRANEINKLVGSTNILKQYVDMNETFSITDTLKSMYLA